KVLVVFKKGDGTEIKFNEDASSFISSTNNKEPKEVLFTDKVVDGKNMTRKENVGKKFIIEYFDFFGKIVSVKNATTNNSVKPTSIPSVKIGTQEWMTKNLNVTKYRNGDMIPEVQDHDEWMKLKTGAWCNNRGVTKLYNWYAVNDPRGLAPEGWHIP